MLQTKRKIPTAIRRAVYAREEHACALCRSTQALHLHHLLSRAQGGKNTLENLVCLCPTCHAIIHGEYELDNQFPFDQYTAADALEFYMQHLYPPYYDAEDHGLYPF
jgi:hypothetical protein